MGLSTFSIKPTRRGRRDSSGNFLISEGKRIKLKVCRDDTSEAVRIKFGINNASAEHGKNKDFIVRTGRSRSSRSRSILKFKEGQECKNIIIKANIDRRIESDEQLSLFIRKKPSYKVSSKYGSITARIIDDGMYGGGSSSGGEPESESNSESEQTDHNSKFYVKQPFNVYEGEEASFTILRTKTRREESVNFTLSGGNEDDFRYLDPAVSGTDYVPVVYMKDEYGEKQTIGNSVSFAKGESQKTVYVKTQDDPDDCSFHALFLSLNDGSSSKHLEIKDTTEAKNTFSISAPETVKEGDTVELVITRSDKCDKNGYREVVLNVESGTADSSDYNLRSDSYRTTVVFQPGQKTKTIEVPTLEDCIDEGDEYFYYSIEGASQQDQTPRDDQDIPRQYKTTIEENSSANSDCPPTPITCTQEWDDYQKTYVDRCSGEFRDSFKISDSVSMTEPRQEKTTNNQRIDHYTVSDVSNTTGTWKEYLPKLTTRAGAGELVTMYVGFSDINDVLWKYTFFDDAYVESRRRCLNKNKSDSDPLISFQETKDMIEEEYSGIRTFINGERTSINNGDYDGTFIINGRFPRRISVKTGYTIKALPASEDYWHSGTNDYECTEGVYQSVQNYSFELVPV